MNTDKLIFKITRRNLDITCTEFKTKFPLNKQKMNDKKCEKKTKLF